MKAALCGLAAIAFGACAGPGGGTPATGPYVQPDTCSDGIKNVDETGVDCGGNCSGCGVGSECTSGSDCQTGKCEQGLCAEASCDDGLLNGTETAQDCGGGRCPACAMGQACVATSDCAQGVCLDAVCSEAPASCSDGEKNAGESDIDCGGPNCPGCASTKFCNDNDDCLSLTCVFGVCKDPACDDGIQNQGESAVDCGGPCAPCEDGVACQVNGDCASDRCQGGICVSCTNGVKDADELGVDCGGACAACADGTPCDSNAICGSGLCHAGLCVSCSNDLVDGDETGVDCGGSNCDPCEVGAPCGSTNDCGGGGICQDGFCCAPNACGVCGALPGEVCNGVDDDCDGDTDEQASDGPAACPKQDGVCDGAVEACQGAGGWACDDSVYTSHSAAYEADEVTCDGLDNDCDGETDEGLLNSCGECAPEPTEVCNGVDDDCDGETDEGLVNSCGECAPQPMETCNGVDDDCNGQTDESAECAVCGTTVELACASRTGDNSIAWFDGAIWVAFEDAESWSRLVRLGASQTLGSPDLSVTQYAFGAPSIAVQGDTITFIPAEAYTQYVTASGAVSAGANLYTETEDLDIYEGVVAHFGSSSSPLTFWTDVSPSSGSWDIDGSFLWSELNFVNGQVAVGPQSQIALGGILDGQASIMESDGGSLEVVAPDAYVADLAYDTEGRLHAVLAPDTFGPMDANHWMRELDGSWTGPHSLGVMDPRFLRMTDGSLSILGGAQQIVLATPNANYTQWTTSLHGDSNVEEAFHVSGVVDPLGRIVVIATRSEFTSGCVEVTTICPAGN